MKARVILIAFAFSMFGCSPKGNTFLYFTVGFENDTVQVFKGNHILVDSIISTNYSTGSAFKYKFNNNRKSSIVIKVNNSLDTLQFDNEHDSWVYDLNYLDRKITTKSLDAKDLPIKFE